MAGNFNKVILLGNLTRDVEVRQAGSNPVSRQWACSISAQTGHGVT